MNTVHFRLPMPDVMLHDYHCAGILTNVNEAGDIDT